MYTKILPNTQKTPVVKAKNVPSKHIKPLSLDYHCQKCYSLEIFSLFFEQKNINGCL